MRRLPLVLVALALGCGPAIPSRFVLEREISADPHDWSYRRYQRVLDVELPIEGNPAVGHTATYVGRARHGSDTVPFANVFVTVYARAPGLAAEIRRQVRGLASYETTVRDLGGQVFYLDGGPGDRWALWVSGPHVIKVGGGGGVGDVPEAVVREYLGIYSSDLDEHGRARAGTASAGEPEAQRPGDPQDGDETPHFLRDSAPR